MNLEVYNNRTTNTHENEQFRRVVNIINNVFQENNLRGILIGNPYNDLYPRFRADAILYYSHGIILFDFKDYSGTIKLPPNDREFTMSRWYVESDHDKHRISIKAGSRFLNPYLQLKSYRESFKEILSSNENLEGLDASRVCIVNVFSGPIKINNSIPRCYPYYKITQESDLGDMLLDFHGEGGYAPSIKDRLHIMFPSDPWGNETTILSDNDESVTEFNATISFEVESIVKDFLQNETAKVLILKSRFTEVRDSWSEGITAIAQEIGIPQIEKLCHSSRISNKIRKRTNQSFTSMYSMIYGGDRIVEAKDGDEGEEKQQIDGIQEIVEYQEQVPIKSNMDLDERTLFVVNDAHLISRSLMQNSILRFGSGRLLNDFITYMNIKSNRKVIFIGDPYSLTYGKDEDCALCKDSLVEFFKDDEIIEYRDSCQYDQNKTGKSYVQNLLTQSIDNHVFNFLNYKYDGDTIEELSSEHVSNKLELYFSKPFDKEPSRAVLMYKREDCDKTNRWIKRNCLKNGELLTKGDLLIVYNNIIIPNENGCSALTRISNGMYFTVEDVLNRVVEYVSIRQSKKTIELRFQWVIVRCISLSNNILHKICILDNYLHGGDDLSQEEKIAFHVYVNKRVNELSKERSFSESSMYKDMLNSDEYNCMDDKLKNDVKLLAIKKEIDSDNEQEIIHTKQVVRSLVSKYKKKYKKALFLELRKIDPYVNAAFVKYGWAITVHKSVGSRYDEAILKGFRMDNDGINNEGYYRWLYSALAAVKNKVYLNSPQYISPLDNTEFINKVECGIEDRTYPICYNEYEPDIIIKSLLKDITNINVIGCVCELNSIIVNLGGVLDKVIKCSDFLTKMRCMFNERDELIINIYNKGKKEKWAVSDIMIDKSLDAIDGALKSQIKEFLHTPRFMDIPTDERSSLYTSWINSINGIGGMFGIVEMHNNQDIWMYIKDENIVKFRVWYLTSEQNHTKGFISKIEIMEKSNDGVVELIKNVIYG